MFSHQIHSKTAQCTSCVLLTLTFLCCLLLFSSLITACTKPVRKMWHRLKNSKMQNIKIYFCQLYCISQVLQGKEWTRPHRNPFLVTEAAEMSTQHVSTIPSAVVSGTTVIRFFVIFWSQGPKESLSWIALTNSSRIPGWSQPDLTLIPRPQILNLWPFTNGIDFKCCCHLVVSEFKTH